MEAQFKKALTVAKIDKALVFHDLRHTFASRLKRRGGGGSEIQRLLGHKTLQMTDRYIAVQVEQLRTVLGVLSDPSTNGAHGSRPSTNLTQKTAD